MNNTIISIYSSTTFENVSNLKGHNGKVRSVVWSADDSKIVSCGMDGAVYEWDAYSGKRIGESVLKSCSYTGVTITPDGKNIYAVGNDKTIKEINDSQVRSLSRSTLTSLAINRYNKALYFLHKFQAFYS